MAQIATGFGTIDGPKGCLRRSLQVAALQGARSLELRAVEIASGAAPVVTFRATDGAGALARVGAAAE